MKCKKWLADYIPALLAALLIIVFSVLRAQSFIKTLPTLITLVVQILLCHANRFGFLIGGINALIYGISYFDERLYFSCISAVLISAPIQLYSFFHWSKRQTRANHTALQSLHARKRLAVAIFTLVLWLAVYFGLHGLFTGGRLPYFDSFHFVMGIIVSLLAAFRFVESQYFGVVSGCTTVVMWGLICADAPSNVNYLIISCYNLFMVAKAAVHWTRQYMWDKYERERNDEFQNVVSATAAGK